MESHKLHGLTIFPVQLSSRQVYDGVDPNKLREIYVSSSSDVSRLRAAREDMQRTVLRRLSEAAPGFIEPGAQPSETQHTNLYHGVCFKVPLQRGRVEAEVSVFDDLGGYLNSTHANFIDLWADGRKELAEQVRGRPGIVLSGTYHLTSRGERGVQLGRFGSGLGGFSNDEKSRAFATALNLLCSSEEINGEIVKAILKDGYRMYPIGYSDGTTEIAPNMANLSAQNMRIADQPVGEFMEWLHDNRGLVNAFGEFVRLAMESYKRAGYHSERSEKGIVDRALPETIETVGDMYLEMAVDIQRRLQPPKNNRMDFLVNQTRKLVA